MSVPSETVSGAVEQLARLTLQEDSSSNGGTGTDSNTSSDSRTSKQPIDWQQIAQFAETCANSLRSGMSLCTLLEGVPQLTTQLSALYGNVNILAEQARTDLGSGPLLSTCAECLRASAAESVSPVTLAAQTQLCRVIGNATLDHRESQHVVIFFKAAISY